MRVYADLSVRPGDVGGLVEIARAARRLGVALLAVEVSEGLDAGDLERAREEVGGNPVIIPRFTVRASTRSEARRGIDSAPRGALVVVEARGLDALRYAGVNKRVHIVRPAPGLEAAASDKSQARLFAERGWGAVEYPLARLLRGGRGTWASFISMTRRAYANSIDLVLVSDAEEWLDLWHPRSIAGLLVAAAGLPEDRALALAANAPWRVLSRLGVKPPD